MSSSPLRVAVLLGGMSAERDVSLVSGHECAKAIRTLGHDVIEIDVDENLGIRLSEANPDVVFNALHGRYGEDGTVQGVLEVMKIPYTHSGVLASALAMDKEKTKLAYKSVGLPVAKSLLAARSEVSARHLMPPPYVVKPYNEGSSVGVYIVEEGANQPPVIADDMPDLVMVEDYLSGRELTVAVQGDRALGVTEIIVDGWYDYDAKYKAGGSRHVFPADLPDEITAKCKEYAIKAHEVLGCRGVSRTDFRWDDTRGVEGLFLLETNTQPGMTPTSLAPEQAAGDGQEFSQFIHWMLEDASCNR